jgi:hypothetical protein
MSEFKFACPICGQHITADSKDTGSQIPCPTCYRKIVVPQAPASGDPKFVLSASEVNKPRPTQTSGHVEPVAPKPEKSSVPVALIILAVFAVAACATLIVLRGRSSKPKPSVEQADNSESNTNRAQSKPEPAPQPEYTGTNLWALDLAKVSFPDTPVFGSVHRRAFAIDRASISTSNLTLRVGRTGTVELGLNIVFFNRQAEELSGKTAVVKPEDTVAPRVVLHWMETERKSETFRAGYAMKVEFGPVANGVLPGKIYLCLPDGAQSWVAGTFRAEIRKPNPPRPRTPAQSSAH